MKRDWEPDDVITLVIMAGLIVGLPLFATIVYIAHALITRGC